MNINHHLTDPTLAAFSAGALIESISLVAASHLSICPDCTKRCDQLENIGGIQLQHAEPTGMSPDSLNKVMIKLGNQEPPLVSRPAKNSILSLLGGPASIGNSSEIPKPMRAHVPDRLEDVNWKSMAPGIKYFAIKGLETADGSLGLLKIAPGVNIPQHGHRGIELTYVLKGSFSDETGRFGVGDIADLDDDTEHEPIADTNEACICLIATESPLKFNDLMPRMVQYYSRM